MSYATSTRFENRGRVIAVAQRKGGVGKTTIAVSLAGELHRRSFSVCLVDADPQGSASHWAEGGELRFPVVGMPIPSRSVAAWAQSVRSLSRDIVIVDAPPHDHALGAAAALASLVLIPCTPSTLDLDATRHTVAVVQAVRARREQSLGALIVPSRVDLRTLEGQQLQHELHQFGEAVASPIGSRASFVRAVSAGQAVCDFAFGSKADLEIRGLAIEVLGNLAPCREHLALG